jgi:hypothetical protein
MKHKEQNLKIWLQSIELALPGLSKALQACGSEVMVIGASLMTAYSSLGWIPPLKRSTGDLDLSVTISPGRNDYEKLKQVLLDHHYCRDEHYLFRYCSPNRFPNQLNYIDLLAQPGPGVAAGEAILTMGSGPEFSFEGFDFAKKSAIRVDGHILFPNPFGFIALKRASYRDDPTRRRKDFADILELIDGLVEKGTHYDLKDVWDEVKNEPDAHQVLMLLRAIALNKSTEWDIEDARNDLSSRGFSEQAISEGIFRAAGEFLLAIE